MPTPRSTKALVRRARWLGAGASLLALGAIALTWVKTVGEPSPPALSTTRFTVAVLSGPKQAAQTAPENVENASDAVEIAQSPVAPVVEASRSTSLPDAVSATPDARPSLDAPQPAEVIPPARVSMPGGRLSVEDAPMGDTRDPFAVGPDEVYVRVWINAQGKVIRGGIVRNGREPLRDALIYRAFASRTFDTRTLPPSAAVLAGEEGVWQLDQVLRYGGSDFLP